jgi:hypothetical protein
LNISQVSYRIWKKKKKKKSNQTKKIKNRVAEQDCIKKEIEMDYIPVNPVVNVTLTKT